MSGLNGLMGLTSLKKRAEIAIKSCNARNAIFPHTLLYGIGGTGKTSFARAIGEELGYHYHEVEGATLKDREQVIRLLKDQTVKAAMKRTRLLLFVDECHRLSVPMQEVFYIPMVDWKINIPYAKRPQKGVEALPVGTMHFNKFTLFGATTRVDLLDVNSFYARFINHWHIDRYPDYEMAVIVEHMLKKEKLGHKMAVRWELARRCLGIPRRASNLVKKVRDYVIAHGRTEATADDVYSACELEGIDQIGLDRTAIRYLIELERSSGVPRGLSGLAASLEEPEDLLSGVVEPILLSLGFISMGTKGRIITSAGLSHLHESSVKIA